MEYAAIIAGAISAITALVSMGQEAEAQRLRKSISAQYGEEVGTMLDDALAQEAGKSGFEGLTEDSTGRQTQLDVDQELANIYDSGGRTQEDEAAFNVARRGVSQRAAQRASDAAITAAQRGQTAGPMGAVLASQSGQDELEALAGLNAEVAASGRQRALQALQARGQMAGQMRGQDWQQLSERANATDLMNRFNASQRAGFQQNQIDNRMGLADRQAAAISGEAAGLAGQAAGTRQMGAGLANSALSYGQAWDWGQKKKEEGKK